MKKFYLIALLLSAAFTATAQTLNIHSGQVTVAVPAEDAGEMTYTGGTSLTVNGATYDLTAVDSITIDNSTVEAATVSVTYDGTLANVLVSGDVAPYMTIAVAGADVSIVAAATLAEEVTYRLSGTSTDGSFTMDGEYKSTVELNNLTLTSSTGAAVNIENGKRINVVIPTGTTTTLVDGASGSQKACLFVNGHAEFSGGGSLILTGNTRHAYASDEYTILGADFGSIQVLGSANDGLHIEQYFQMDGGTVTVSNVTGDGIDVGITKDATDELNGQVIINGGTITLDVASDDAKGIKCDSLMTIAGGTITANVSGDGCKGFSAGTDLYINQTSGNATSIDMTVTGTTYMPDDPNLESKCRGIKVKGNFYFDGGTIKISATGAKSKAISVDGNYYYTSGSLNCAVDAANT
ncbi:MAG: carbohydrate-binding domain-containing protein [Bacteroidales bacterium]|nr:carbohydrate-binding domain-containing protein [Bacteroidales bacterium]